MENNLLKSWFVAWDRIVNWQLGEMGDMLIYIYICIYILIYILLKTISSHKYVYLHDIIDDPKFSIIF